MTRYIIIVAIFLLSLTISVAQAPSKGGEKKLIDMPVDMPDETQETDLIQKGKWQIETAYLHNNYKEGRHSSIWQGLFRYGVSKHLELRLLAETGSELLRYIDETVQSTYPAAASAKVLLVKDHKYLPDVSLITYLHIPFYKISKEKQLYWSPIILFAFLNKLGKQWKLEYNAGIQQEAYSTRWVWLGNASLHYKLLDQLELFAGYFAQYQHGEGPQHNVGGGAGYQINNYITIFAMAGGTVNYAASNHYLNAGAAFRIP